MGVCGSATSTRDKTGIARTRLVQGDPPHSPYQDIDSHDRTVNPTSSFPSATYEKPDTQASPARKSKQAHPTSLDWTPGFRDMSTHNERIVEMFSPTRHTKDEHTSVRPFAATTTSTAKLLVHQQIGEFFATSVKEYCRFVSLC